MASLIANLALFKPSAERQTIHCAQTSARTTTIMFRQEPRYVSNIPQPFQYERLDLGYLFMF